LQRSLARFLGRSDLEVCSVRERAQAIGFLASGMFDLLVTDLVLPDGSGADLVEDAMARGMEVIVITADGSPQVRARLAARSVPCLAKPFDLDLLQSAVDRALGRCPRRTP
jgi:two-component system nitrogen regulation response regulator GlnG